MIVIPNNQMIISGQATWI